MLGMYFSLGLLGHLKESLFNLKIYKFCVNFTLSEPFDL